MRPATASKYVRLLSVLSIVSLSHGFSIPIVSFKRMCCPESILWHSKTESPGAEEGSDEIQSILEQASMLREQANELESKLRREGRPELPIDSKESATVVPSYRKIEDSVWMFTYRFAGEPRKDDEDDEAAKPVLFAGKITLKLREDGFTDVISHDPSTTDSALEIEKAWGWDVETSSEDEKEYLLLSVDAVLPTTGEKQRFYLQARKDRENGAIVLKEGTVTVKQDVRETGSSSWLDAFVPKGILARFTYVGDFAARATA